MDSKSCLGMAQRLCCPPLLPGLLLHPHLLTILCDWGHMSFKIPSVTYSLCLTPSASSSNPQALLTRYNFGTIKPW